MKHVLGFLVSPDEAQLETIARDIGLKTSGMYARMRDQIEKKLEDAGIPCFKFVTDVHFPTGYLFKCEVECRAEAEYGELNKAVIEKLGFDPSKPNMMLGSMNIGMLVKDYDSDQDQKNIESDNPNVVDFMKHLSAFKRNLGKKDPSRRYLEINERFKKAYPIDEDSDLFFLKL